MSGNAAPFRLVANPRRCCGAGRCAGLAPELFEQSLSDGTVIVRVAQPPAELASLAREAVALCPTRALAIVELV